MNDYELLRGYAQNRDQEAFGQLVERHLAMVYSTARRMVRDEQLAQDVAQSVFTTLAQKAGTVSPPQVVGGWLYNTTRHLAMHAVRTEQRRREREQAAAIMQSLETGSAPDQFIEQLEPAMAELDTGERDALVLRYLENRSLREVGIELGIGEDAARMRVNRALERLRTVFAGRGADFTSVLLASVLVSSTSSAVPPGLATTITAAALAGAAAATIATTQAVVTTVSWFNAKAVVAVASATVIIGTGIYLTQRLKMDQSPADHGNQTAQREMVTADNEAGLVATQTSVDEPSWFMQESPPPLKVASVDFDWRPVFLTTNAPPRLPRAEVEKYLDRKGRDAASLLAAYHALADTNYLKEAAANFPDDPKVQWTVLVSDIFPEARRRWLELFKASSPDNSLPDYFSARDYLNGHYVGQLGDRRVFGGDNLSAKEYLESGQAQTAISELLEATSKPSFKDYSAESRLDEEALNVAAGRSPIESKLASRGWAAHLAPQMATLKAIGYDLEQLQKEYMNIGDIASAEHLTQIGLALAARLKGGDTGKHAGNQMNALGFEALLIRSWDLNTSYDFLGGKTPKNRLEEIRRQRDEIKALFPAVQSLKLQMTAADVLSYLERAWQFGDVEAARWLLQQRGLKPQP